jgi:hypothetical protein
MWAKDQLYILAYRTSSVIFWILIERATCGIHTLWISYKRAGYVWNHLNILFSTDYLWNHLLVARRSKHDWYPLWTTRRNTTTLWIVGTLLVHSTIQDNRCVWGDFWSLGKKKYDNISLSRYFCLSCENQIEGFEGKISSILSYFVKFMIHIWY